MKKKSKKRENETNALKKAFNQLKNEKAALQVQSRLLENFVAFARSSATERLLVKLLRKTLEVSAELSGAEKGSLFLLDAHGAVTDSILTREDTTPEQCSRILGTVLEKGLAGWVKHHRKAGLIADTSTDSRWLDLPNQPYKVGSALAVPILRGDNLLGILTLLHARPGHFNAETADLMQLTAGQIGSALENARLYSKLDESYRSLAQAKQEIETYSRALDAELEKGKKIQRDFLPSQIPQIDGWEIAVYFHPARQVSGDFYDVFLLPRKRVGLVIADVCDKGVGSALYMALFRSLIRVFSGQISLRGFSVTGSDRDERIQPGEDLFDALHAVALTNDYIAEEHGQEGMFATLFFGVLNPDTGRMAYISGGHEPLFIVSQAGARKSLKATGPVVGMMPGMPFKVQQIQIEPGEILLGFTDGVTEALSPAKSLFTKKRFLSLLEKPAPTAVELIAQIKTDLFAHIDNAPQFDDITMIAAQRLRN
jgi:sigma-B regulation protein RsbU (phosphoserine phosphatase)